MLNLDRFNLTDLKSKFQTAEPFHHIVIDHFLDENFMKEVEKEVRSMPQNNWFDNTTDFKHINNEMDSPVQSKKIALNIRKQIPERANVVMDVFSSEEFKKFMEEITDISDLQIDETMMGGGLHKTTTGGRLAIHADFNIHPATKKHRRINALLYLNSEWKPEYNGELELWSKDMSHCLHKIEPVLNRLVIFRITDDAFHGHPEVWKAPFWFPRLSFAFYYYTDNRPEHEKSDFHWASWQKRDIMDF